MTARFPFPWDDDHDPVRRDDNSSADDDDDDAPSTHRDPSLADKLLAHAKGVEISLFKDADGDIHGHYDFSIPVGLDDAKYKNDDDDDDDHDDEDDAEPNEAASLTSQRNKEIAETAADILRSFARGRWGGK